VNRLSERFEVVEREEETTRETVSFKLPRGLEVAA
jgi:4-hydroxy-3-methylbut-2-enyl diphosphate reductase